MLAQTVGDYAKVDLIQDENDAMAVAHCVKAVARERGWKYNTSNEHVQQNPRILARKTSNIRRALHRLPNDRDRRREERAA